MCVDFTGHLSHLQLAVINMARKQLNFRLAERLLLKEVASVTSQHPENGKISSHRESLLSALSTVHTSQQDSLNQPCIMHVEREGAKLLHVTGQHREAIETLSRSIVGNLTIASSQVHPKEHVSVCSELNARSLLALVKWLQADHKSLAALMSQLKLNGQGDESATTHVAQNLKQLLEQERDSVQQKKGISLDDGEEGECIIFFYYRHNSSPYFKIRLLLLLHKYMK